jgi:hypothetical protein
MWNRGVYRVPRFSFRQGDNQPLRAWRLYPSRLGNRVEADESRRWRQHPVIILGIVCLILGAVFDAGILWAIGVILVVLGVIFWILGAMGRAVGGRRHYY